MKKNAKLIYKYITSIYCICICNTSFCICIYKTLKNYRMKGRKTSNKSLIII